jgi:hypothetical protein
MKGFGRPLLVVVILGGVFLAVTWFQRGRECRDLGGGYFEGTIPGLGPVSLGFWDEEGGMAGQVTLERSGIPRSLTGARTGTGSGRLVHLTWSQVDYEDAYGALLLVVNVTADGATLNGTWREFDDAEPRVFRLERVASVRELRATFALRFREYGHRSRFRFALPRPVGGSEVFSDALLRDVEKQRDQFLGRVEDVWDGFRNPGFSNDWDYQAGVVVRRLDSWICSLMAETYPYRGGNGNWTRYHEMNFAFVNGRVRSFRLSELFVSGTAWDPFLRVYCATDLRRQGASRMVLGDGELPETDFKLFTVSEGGIQIYFDPYEVASGAEGCFMVHVPFSDLRPYLDPQGLGGKVTARRDPE